MHVHNTYSMAFNGIVSGVSHGGGHGGGDGNHGTGIDRKRSRDLDIGESYYLLLELGTQEPVLQHCLKTLQGMCLSQGVKLAKKGTHDQDPETKKWSSQATDKFQKHIDKYVMCMLLCSRSAYQSTMGPDCAPQTGIGCRFAKRPYGRSTCSGSSRGTFVDSHPRGISCPR